ncbi:MAG: methyltransferase [Kofleriaceae bacterium]
MADVFGIVGSEAFLCDAAIAAADQLALFAAAPQTVAELARSLGLARSHRLRALVDVLCAIGAAVREDDRIRTIRPPVVANPVTEGWGTLATVIRSDRPLVADADPAMSRYHAHLVQAGADAARELVARLPGTSLLDLGGGAGAYTAAFLDADPVHRATLVDTARVLALAAEHLARFGDRVRFVAGDAREVAVDHHDVALLANVLHLHPPGACAELIANAARHAATVVVKDLAVDEDRSGPLVGLMFALAMALYTDAGDLYSSSQIGSWLAAAGHVAIAEHRLVAAPASIVTIASNSIANELRASLARTGTTLELPPALVRVLARAIAVERAEPSPDGEARLVQHYTVALPRRRIAQLADPPALFTVPLDWARLPRLASAIDRLFAIVGEAAERALGASSADAFRARTTTLAELYARTHYGGAMPLLYGNPADLAYIAHRARERDLDALAAIDRYLTAPILHELCHFARARRTVDPPHLDECIGGWLGVYVHPEFAYPAPGEDDALYAAPWLAQVGQAVARAFGIAAVVDAYATGQPLAFVATAARLGHADWQARRTLHLLSDTLDPAPWVALALVAGAGGSLANATLASLAATPLAGLELPPDPAFDRAILGDALRAMCLEDFQVAGSPRTRFAPAEVVIDAPHCRVTSGARRYWLPPAIAATIGDRRELRLDTVAAIPAAITELVGE